MSSDSVTMTPHLRANPITSRPAQPRLLINYVHTDVKGGPFAATAVPAPTQLVDERKFSTDAVAVRAQIDF
jgi:hypothetical protein